MKLVAAAMLLAMGPVVRAAPGAIDPHMDPSTVRGSCRACHRGHGAPKSPMLPATQKEVCLACHGTQASRDRMVADGKLDASARPQSLAPVLSRPFSHPLTDDAFSRSQPGAVTCTSCHSPHRGTRARAAVPQRLPGKKISPRDPSRFEYELCESCHGQRGVTTPSFLDMSRLLNANSRSRHPVEAVSSEPSPSVLPNLSGGEINCTDCHGNSDPAGPKGPHGSTVRYILAYSYTTVDGSSESLSAYALCYVCHDREKVLGSSLFPEHRSHVIDLQTSCATCHDAHGSVNNRSLIRFGEETNLSSVFPSVVAGRIAFESDAPGSGACYLTCHGRDHAPGTYGTGAPTGEVGGNRTGLLK